MERSKATKEWLYANNDLPVKELIEKLNKKQQGTAGIMVSPVMARSQVLYCISPKDTCVKH